MAEPSPFPREHGAWAMLLQPFLGALVVYRHVAWPLLPALGAVVLVFLVREPLIVAARQRWVWRVERPESAPARRRLLIELGLLALVGAALATVWPWWILAILGGSAGVLTMLAVYMNVRGRQRAVWFQALSAAGLASSGLAACLAMEGRIPAWAWWFWALHAAHYLAAILVVHARLDARIAARKGEPFARPLVAIAAAFACLLGAVALAVMRMPFYAAALVVSAVVHVINLRSVATPKSLTIPLTTVGLRAMALSIAVTLLLVAGS